MLKQWQAAGEAEFTAETNATANRLIILCEFEKLLLPFKFKCRFSLHSLYVKGRVFFGWLDRNMSANLNKLYYSIVRLIIYRQNVDNKLVDLS